MGSEKKLKDELLRHRAEKQISDKKKGALPAVPEDNYSIPCFHKAISICF
jgi:hypothetical protein